MPSVVRKGLSIHYEDVGHSAEGEPPLVLAHSFLCNGEMWRPQVEALSSRHRIINVDLRGHGRSGPVRGPCTLYDMADDLVAVLDDAGVEAAIGCGLSIGGMITMRVALRHPERILGMALVSTHAGPELAFKRAKYKAMSLWTRAAGVAPLLPAVLPLMFGKTTRAANPGLVARWRAIFASVDPASTRWVLGALLGRDDLVGELPNLRQPALVIVGEEDKAISPSQGYEIHEHLPDAEFLLLAGCGHLASLERPRDVSAGIASLAARVVRARAS